MKNLLSSLAFAAIAFTTLNPAAHADSIAQNDGLQLTINGAAVVGVYNPLTQAVVFTDVLDNTTLFHGSLLSDTVSTITATYTDVDGLLGNLNVVDLCVSTTLLGKQNNPCSNVSIVGTITGVGPLNADVGALALVGADIALGYDHSTDLGLAGVYIGGANGNIQFNQPPPPPVNNSPVPEPGSLSLMATGLLAAAGAVRRKFIA